MNETDRTGSADSVGGEQPWTAPDVGPTQPVVPVSTAVAEPGSFGPSTADRVVPPVRLRPMTVTEILDGSYRVIRTRPRTVVVITAAIMVPIEMLSALASRSSLAGFGAMFGQRGAILVPTDAGTVTATDVFLSLTSVLGASLALFFLGGALTHLVTQWYLGRDPSAGEALKTVFRRTWGILAIWAVLLVAKMASAVACYIGLLFTVPLFSLTAPVMVAENIGPIAAASRSWNLISRRLWRNIGIVMLAALVESTLTQVLTALPTALAMALPEPFNWVTLGVTTSAASLVTKSALVCGSVLLYLDMRVRTEGLDLEIDAIDVF